MNTNPNDLGLLFVLGERVVPAYELMARPKPKASKGVAMKRTRERDEATHSAGFMVLGYTPTTWANLPGLHTEAMRLHTAGPTEHKHPGDFEEWRARWMTKNKPKRVRSKPYELEDAANVCAELARKAGWMHVRLDEVMRVDTLAGKAAI